MLSIFEIKKIKDEYVYHGSPNGGIKILKPKPSKIIDYENAVFATSEKWLAISFIRFWKDSDFQQGFYNNKPYMKEQYKDVFDKIFNKGGWLYYLKKDTFVHDSRLMNVELISKVSVKPEKKEYIRDPIKEMKKLGLCLFRYEDQKEFEKFKGN